MVLRPLSNVKKLTGVPQESENREKTACCYGPFLIQLRPLEITSKLVSFRYIVSFTVPHCNTWLVCILILLHLQEVGKEKVYSQSIEKPTCALAVLQKSYTCCSTTFRGTILFIQSSIGPICLFWGKIKHSGILKSHAQQKTLSPATYWAWPCTPWKFRWRRLSDNRLPHQMRSNTWNVRLPVLTMGTQVSRPALFKWVATSLMGYWVLKMWLIQIEVYYTKYKPNSGALT